MAYLMLLCFVIDTIGKKDRVTSAVNRHAVLSAIKKAQSERAPITGRNARRQALSLRRYLGLHHSYRAKIEECLNTLVSEGAVVVRDATLRLAEPGETTVHVFPRERGRGRRKTRRPGRKASVNGTMPAADQVPADVLARYAVPPLPCGWDKLSHDAPPATPEVLVPVAGRCSCEQLAEYVASMTPAEVLQVAKELTVDQIDALAEWMACNGRVAV